MVATSSICFATLTFIISIRKLQIMTNKLSKIKLLVSLFLAASVSFSYGVTFSGTAAQGLLGQGGAALVDGQSTFLVVDTANNGFASISIGDDLSAGTTFGGDDYILAYTNTAYPGFASIASFTSFSFNLGENGVAASQSFALYVFEGTTSTTAAAGFYGIGTDATWTIPTANSETWDFNSVADSDSFLQLSSLQTSLSVVPEPSTCAALSGLLALSSVMLRRRRA